MKLDGLKYKRFLDNLDCDQEIPRRYDTSRNEFKNEISCKKLIFNAIKTFGISSTVFGNSEAYSNVMK